MCLNSAKKEVIVPKRKDIREAPDEEKYQIYQQIAELAQKGISVTVKEHKSGFPAITVDCGDISILTDCISAEIWSAKQKEKKGDAG